MTWLKTRRDRIIARWAIAGHALYLLAIALLVYLVVP